MRWSLLSLALVGVAALAYVMYTPAPEGITEPWKYSAFCGMLKTCQIIAKVLAYFDDGNYWKHYRHVRHWLRPATPSEIPGSNIRSRVTTFDGIKVRLYEPIKKQQGLSPALVFIHGGGFVIGSTETYDSVTRKIAEGLDMVVASIDYRLAPEFKIPTQHEDNLKAISWFMQNAEQFGIDSNHIGVAGDSAGGLMTAYISQVIHDDESLPDIKFQGLIYPFTQGLDFYTPSYQKYAKFLGEKGVLPRSTVIHMVSSAIKNDGDLSNASMLNMHTSAEFKTRVRKLVNHDDIPVEMKDEAYYMPPADVGDGDAQVWEKYRSIFLNRAVSPLLRDNMTGLPPAYIVTCGFDNLRDDGILYAKKLERAGVETILVNYDGGFHGMLWEGRFFEFQLAKEALQKFIILYMQNILYYVPKNKLKVKNEIIDFQYTMVKIFICFIETLNKNYIHLELLFSKVLLNSYIIIKKKNQNNSQFLVSLIL
ncbi:arylacetamide deacetylase-like [Anneissia japonica]|uniref:arylacetamide deacetylase-like n=1 Tax=Anneissia japonica TaxID=1529436 RepID=UPI00142588BD|nr:arylacetamide deacetylase-like [Anneissia japonica]